MAEDKVKLQINGVDWQGWLSLQVTKSVEAVAGGFSLGLTEKWQEEQKSMPFACGMECKIFFENDEVINGYIDAVDHSFDATSHSVTVNGRDKSGDLVDNSAVHNPGEFLKLNILDIVNQVASPFGVVATSQGDLGDIFPIYKVETGEKALDCIVRGLKQRELLAIPDKGGNVLLAKLGASKMGQALEQGKNILSANMTIDAKNRHSDYIAQGQQKGTDDAFGKACSTKGTVKDAEIERYRPLVIRSTQQGNADFMKKRAEWQCKTDRAKGTSLKVVVQGFRTDDGELWEIGKLVDVKLDYFGLDQELLITEVVFSRALGSGSTTELVLKDKDAFSPEPVEDSATSSSSSTSSSSASGGGSSNLSMYVQQSIKAKEENDRIAKGAS